MLFHGRFLLVIASAPAFTPVEDAWRGSDPYCVARHANPPQALYCLKSADTSQNQSGIVFCMPKRYRTGS